MFFFLSKLEKVRRSSLMTTIKSFCLFLLKTQIISEHKFCQNLQMRSQSKTQHTYYFFRHHNFGPKYFGHFVYKMLARDQGQSEKNRTLSILIHFLGPFRGWWEEEDEDPPLPKELVPVPEEPPGLPLLPKPLLPEPDPRVAPFSRCHLVWAFRISARTSGSLNNSIFLRSRIRLKIPSSRVTFPTWNVPTAGAPPPDATRPAPLCPLGGVARSGSLPTARSSPRAAEPERSGLCRCPESPLRPDGLMPALAAPPLPRPLPRPPRPPREPLPRPLCGGGLGGGFMISDEAWARAGGEGGGMDRSNAVSCDREWNVSKSRGSSG